MTRAETIKALVEKLSRLEIRLPFPARIDIDETWDPSLPGDVIRYFVKIKVPERDTRKVGTVAQEGFVTTAMAEIFVSNDVGFLRWIHDLLRERLLHELGEAIFFDGACVFDPHDSGALQP